MLILTRKLGESIAIGDRIIVRVVEVKGGQVRLGIEAPQEMRILREEIYQKVQEENRNAAAWNLADLEKAVSAIGTKKKE
ncbi:carbon storage regulator CsrA [Geobacter sp. DSM 9736]|uniref:carbon storage regulator CsrA n=1 Tax=Geobacter sp. DSM 9736 TaxID=1277350 RepID=UPI000B512026|nr:carbon storage regulator CsrA [Geobacter sp. DSM 9736]SNB47031.1 carbon storage regulator, CsrA [Geobacter sp. DSM 9736]